MLPSFLTLFALLGLALGGSCPPGYDLQADAGNLCYQFNHTPLDYFSAQYHCSLGGGALATISNAFANTYVRSQLMPAFPYYHIGVQSIIYPYAPNMTRWIDGSPLYFNFYAPGEPKEHKCGAMVTATGLWMASNCANVFPFVCSAYPHCG